MAQIQYLVKRDLHDTSLLLKDWSFHNEQTLKEIQREFNEDYPSFTQEQKNHWTDMTNFKIRSLLLDLAQCTEIIRLDDYISQLYNRINSLESDIAALQMIIIRSRSLQECLKDSKYFDLANHGLDAFTAMTKSYRLANNMTTPESAKFVPVIGEVYSGLSILNSIQCYLSNP